MKTFRELLRTDTYWISKIQNDLFNAVEDYLTEKGMTRSQFAEQLGVTKGYVSQVLGGDFNHRVSKLVELALAIGKAPVLEFEDLNDVVEKETQGFVRKKSCYVPRAPFSVSVRHGAMESKSIELSEKTVPLSTKSLNAPIELLRNQKGVTYKAKEFVTYSVNS